MLETENVLRQLGLRVRFLRKSQKLTQMDLSEKAGIADVGDVERGSANVTVSSLLKISKALSVQIRDLFDFPGLEEPLREQEKIQVEICQLLKTKDLAIQQRVLNALRAFWD